MATQFRKATTDRNEDAGRKRQAIRPGVCCDVVGSAGEARAGSGLAGSAGPLFTLAAIWEGEGPAEPGLDVGLLFEIAARREPRPSKSSD